MQTAPGSLFPSGTPYLYRLDGRIKTCVLWQPSSASAL